MAKLSRCSVQKRSINSSNRHLLYFNPDPFSCQNQSGPVILGCEICAAVMLGTELASVSEAGGGALDYDLISVCECPHPTSRSETTTLCQRRSSPYHSSIALIINHNTWVSGGTH